MALLDLSRLQVWCNGTDLTFYRTKDKQAFALSGLSEEQITGDLTLFIDDNVKIYQKIQIIENDLKDNLIIENELTPDDIVHIFKASSSLSPQRIKYSGSHSINVGKMTLEELEIFNYNDKAPVLQITYSEVLPEDCFQLLGKYIVLGIRRIKLIEPHVMNIIDAKTMANAGEDVILQLSSKKNKAILEYMNLPREDILL